MSIRLLLADDHAMVRKGLQVFLADTARYYTRWRSG